MSLSARPVVLGTATLFRLKPLARALSSIAGLLPVVAWAQLPTNGTVVAGAAVINQTDANTMSVQQSSGKAILNWQQFSIGQQGYVQFIQPGASAIALNRVVGADPSAILGRLSANGQVFLINPNGVVLGAGSKVDVAGLVATTLNISDDDFLKGDYRFQAPAHDQGAVVVNAGTIDTAAGGYVVLAGDYVKNEGVIQAPAGTALLAAGKALTLQLSGSNLVDFAVDEATVVELAGVDNAGQILANGGRVIMTAKVANDLASTVVNNSGLIQAQSTVEKGGVIYLVGEGGSVANAGALDASAQAGADGGNIDMRASGDVLHKTGSHATVSGADSGHSDAGELYSWADGTNRYQQGAFIEARGGAEGGDGGQVEISGERVAVQEIVDLRAPHGKLGTLSLDPNYIYISADGTDAGAVGTPDSVIAEVVLEGQLKVGNVQHTADGADAKIIFGTLSDGVLDGTNNGSGGSLTLLASGSGAPSIAMNTNDTLRVDGALNFAVDDGVNPAGSMTLGNLQAGTSITLDAGAISTGNLSINKAINTSTDTAYTIAARAHTGNLTVNGDVSVNVTNTTAAAVATGVSLRADAGAVTVSGDVISNATGKGYYNYNWETPASDAETYFGNQPWSLESQGDHAIGSTLNIIAGTNVAIGGTVDVRAIDTNSTFAGNGGYFQTATATQHNFWRATAADAAATIQADGNVGIGGVTSVIADGYANSSYGEVESFDTMVSNYNFTTGNQTVYTDYSCDDGCGYTASHNYQRNDLKGSFAGNYVWSFGPYTSSLPSVAYNSPSYSQTTDANHQTQAGPMSYTGQAGLTAVLNIAAGGDVVLDGLDTQAINRSNTSAGNYTDSNWGTQDTVGAGLTQSNSIERRYDDNFTNSFTAAPATATATIGAGDNHSVQLNGGIGVDYRVEAQHTAITASGNTQAFAGLTINAGSAGNPAGTGAINIDGPVAVIGASNQEIALTVNNADGAIINGLGAGVIAVTNQYSGGDARAVFTGAGAIDLGIVTVDGGANANFVAVGDAAITVADTTVTAGQMGDFTVAGGGAVSIGTVAVNAGHTGTVDIDGDTDIDLDALAIVAGHTANFYATAAQDLLITGALSATAPRAANIDLDATAGAIHVADQGSVTATAAGSGYDSMVYWNGVANVDVNDAGPMSLEGNVIASARGAADVTIGSGSAISVGGDAAVRAISQENTAAVTIGATSALQLDGDVLAQANLGAATATLTTSGGASAGIGQASASSVVATGISATLTAKAGAAGVLNAGNAAALDLLGTLQATATTGQAALTVGGAGGTLNNFSAVSSGNTASAAITSYDGAAPLTLAGAGTVTANNNGATAAQLLVVAANDLTADQATLQVKNNNAGSAAGARALLTADGKNTVGDLSVNTNGGGNVQLLASGGFDVAANGELKATAHAGTASIALTSDTGKTEIGSQGSASAVSGSNTATVIVAGGTDVGIGGAIAALSTSNAASVQLLAGTGNVSVADDIAVDVTSTSNSASLSADAATGIYFAGDAQVDAGGTLASIDLTSAGPIQMGGVFGANASTGKAAITASSDALLTVGSDADLQAIAGGSESKVLLTGTTGLQLDGDVLAQALSGDALVSLTTLGGKNADLAQGVSSVATAKGQTASLVVKAGDGTTVDSSNAAALNLSGTLAAEASSGSALLTVDGGAGSVNNFAASSSGNTASATVVSYDANSLLALTGSGDVSGSFNGAQGALLTVDAAGSVDAHLATLTVANNNGGGSAGAFADLTATDDIQLGAVAVTTVGGGTAAIEATAASLTVDGALTATSTTGDAGIGLKASAGALTTTAAGDLVALAQSGAAKLMLEGATGIAADGDLTATVAQTGAAASIDLDSAADIAMTGAIAATAFDAATITVSGTHIAVGSTSSLSTTSDAQNSSIQLLGIDGISVDGNLVASSTGGDAAVDLITSGGITAAISQGANSGIVAAGQNGALTVQAGNPGMIDSLFAAAFNMGGNLIVGGTTGTAELNVQGASGTVHNFTVNADNGTATAKIQAYDAHGALTLDGNGSVTGTSDSANGAVLFATSAGSLDASNATLTITNSNLGSDAGAIAELGADNGRNDFGALNVGSSGGGLAEILASASNGLSAANLSASGNGAIVKLTAVLGALDIGDVTVNGTMGAALNATAQDGDLNQLVGSDLSVNATNGPAAIDLLAADNLALRNIEVSGVDSTLTATAQTGAVTQLTGSTIEATGTNGAASIELLAATNLALGDIAAMGTTAEVKATAQTGGWNQAAGTVLKANAGNGSANVAIGAAGAISVDGNVFAASMGDSATLTIDNGSAALTQGASSVIRAAGTSATTTIETGAMTLGGALQALASSGPATLVVNGGAGSVHDFLTVADAGSATTAFVSTGALVLDGSGIVSGNQDGASGAALSVDATVLDTRNAVLAVGNTHAGADAGAQATLSAYQGSNQLGALSVTSSGGGAASFTAFGQSGLTAAQLLVSGGSALIDLTAATGALELGAIDAAGLSGAKLTATAQQGDLAQRANTSVQVGSANGTAQIDLLASGQLTLRDIAASGASAALTANAQGGALTQLANTTMQVGATSGSASAQLSSAGPLVIDGDILVASIGNAAAATLKGASTITQGADSLIRSTGVDSTTAIEAGAMALSGDLQAVASTGTATLDIDGGAGFVHDFSAFSFAGPAHTQIVSAGTLVLNGAGAVTANHNSADAAALTVSTAGNLDTRFAALAASNNNNGAQAGAVLTLTSGGNLNSGAVAVDATGGGAARMTLHSAGALVVENNLFADAFNTGSGFGSASIILTSGNQAGTGSTIVQNAGSAIRASSAGVDAGDASVLIAAGHCCDSAVQLLGSTVAEVSSGSGQASITVHGATVAVPNLIARNTGNGNSLIALAAPTSVTVNGVLTSQAAAPTAQAGIKLITDTLNYLGPNAVLSQGNGRVQLAPFNTTLLIGVDSKPDFDSTPQMHYNLALLKKFTAGNNATNNAQITFGGAYDRTPWLDAEGKACVPGMDGWADIGQHTGDIHVAGAGMGNLRFAAATMVFDTSGTTYYHDNQMTPWSVPTGRVAIYVPQPTASLDRYLDRTENRVQQLVSGFTDIGATSLYVEAGLPAPEGTVQIAGNMFMDGDGVNMDRMVDDAFPESSSGSGSSSSNPSNNNSSDNGSGASNGGSNSRSSTGDSSTTGSSTNGSSTNNSSTDNAMPADSNSQDGFKSDDDDDDDEKEAKDAKAK
jgi:filamentous hemagglutinin family protein